MLQTRPSARTETARGNLAAYVGKHVEFYRGVEVFEDIPITTKPELVQNFPAHISDEIPNLKRDLLRTLEVADLNLGRSDDMHYACGVVVEQTSGTSGIVLLVPKTKPERLRASLAINDYRRFFDPDFQQRLFYPLVHPPRGIDRPFSPGVLTRENITALYHYLNARAIRWIHINPRLLQAHLELIDPGLVTGGTLRFVESTGFALSSVLRSEVENRWKVRVVDQYGCREAWVMGVRRDSGPFSVVEQNVIVEIVDGEGRSIRTPGQEGRVVVSSIHQRLFPIVRYDTGDLGCWDAAGPGGKLRLSPNRSISNLYLSGKKYDGTEVFKEILYSVYRTLGIHAVKFIRIEQHGDKNFKVITSGIANPAILTIEVERRFNAMHPGDGKFVFESVELTESLAKAALEEKPTLFKRRTVVLP